MTGARKCTKRVVQNRAIAEASWTPERVAAWDAAQDLVVISAVTLYLFHVPTALCSCSQMRPTCITAVFSHRCQCMRCTAVYPSRT